jgi:nitrite reductase/ring-hydroxylating ferredoxin subunit
LEDGRVLEGPAVHAQPVLEVRVRDGQIEVRRWDG